MHPYLRRMITDRARRGRTYPGSNRDYGGQYRVEMEGDYAANGMPNQWQGYPNDGNYMPNYPDGRQGVKYTGPYGIGGRWHYPKDRGMQPMPPYPYPDGNHYPDYGYGNSYDYGGDDMKLEERDMEEWKKNLENADGTRGAHFSLPQIRQASQSLGMRMDGKYDEKDLCMVASMLYSDYCKTLSQWIPKDKEAMVYVKLAKDFLDDPDSAVQGKEKLAGYYYCLVEGMDNMQ